MSGEGAGAARRCTRVVVLGVGNAERGDDAAGLLAVRRVRRERPDLAVREHRGDTADLLAAWDGADLAVVVDAVAGGGPPGTVHRLGAGELTRLRRLRPWSSHGGDLATALELAAALGRLPPELRLYAIAGESFALGAPPAAPVVAAATAVGEEILRALPRVRAAAPGGPRTAA